MNIQKIVYLARDMVYYLYMGCSTRQEAFDYLCKWSGTGYIETYEYKDNYYYFRNAEIIGSSKDPGPVMGNQLLDKRINLICAKEILNLV